MGAVSEASDTAHTRVIHAGATSLQEYVIQPGETVGDWFETDGEVIHYVIAGAIALEIEGLGTWELGPGMPSPIPARFGTAGTSAATDRRAFAFGGV